MRRLLVILVTFLSLIAVSCGAESINAGGKLVTTPVPAPTVAGTVIELEEPEVQAETVLIGVASTDTIMLHALPGIDQPLAGDVAPGTSIEPLGQAFETEDGLLWWQVRSGSLQGWIQPNIAYRAPAEDVTDQVLATFTGQSSYDSAEDAARAVAQHVAAGEGTSDIVVVSTATIENPSSAAVTVDLLGLQDDSIAGYRLIVASAESTGWQPESIIQATLCGRGVSPDGLCL